MLHRRPNAPGSSSSGALGGAGGSTRPSQSRSNTGAKADASSGLAGQTNANANSAYKPLRRQSSNFYPHPDSPSSSSSAAPLSYQSAGGVGVAGRGARLSVSQPHSSPLGLSPTPLNLNYASGPAQGQAYGQSAGYGYGYNPPSNGLDISSEYDYPRGGWKGRLRKATESVFAGLSDATRLERSWNLVWSDRELRTLVLKSTMINLLSLLLLSLSSIIFSPLLVHPISPTMETRTKEIGMWYNVLLSWPVFVVCFWVNASWGPSITRRAQATMHPSHRFQPSPISTPVSSTPSSEPKSPYAWIFTSVTRILLISDFTLVSRMIGYIPLIGKTSSFGYMCVIDAYYFFEWNFLSKHWPLDHRIQYMQDRSAYMLGFGFPATLLTSFGPPLVKMAIFALIYPFFVLQAIQARPPMPTSSSLLPSTPSPHASLPPSPIGGLAPDLNLNDPFFASSSKPTFKSTTRNIFGADGIEKLFGPNWASHIQFKVPIFWLASYALIGVRWLELALARDRSGAGNSSTSFSSMGLGGNGSGLGIRGLNIGSLGKERPGKRAY